MEHLEFAVLQARVERLERRMRVVVAGWVVSAVVFVLLGVAVQQAVSQSEVVRARRIEVVDEAGRTRALLAARPGDGAPALHFLDATGRLRIALVTVEGSTGLSLYDAEGRTRIVLAILPDAPPGLRLWDAAGRVLFRAP